MQAHVVAAGPSIAWSQLAEVIGVSIVVSVGLVVLFAVGVRMLSYGTTAESSSPAKTGIAVASVLFLVCAGIAAYGIFLLIQK